MSMAPFYGIPGKLKLLLTRIANTTVPLTDTHLNAITNNLNATVSSRADGSIWTSGVASTISTKLDVAVSTVKPLGQFNLVRDTSVTTDTLGAFANEMEGLGAPYTAGAITAPTYVELLNITAAGWVYLVVTYREASFASGTLSTKITIDGDVWDIITDSTSTTTFAGHVALGVLNAGNTMIMPLRIRFNTSLKVEIVSSVNQTTGKATSRILYSVDT